MARQFGENYQEAGLTEKQVSMLEFAEYLTVTPSSISQEHVNILKDVGWTDEDVVDIVHITGLFNYLVRVADGLGVELPANKDRKEMTRPLSFRNDIVLKPFGNIA